MLKSFQPLEKVTLISNTSFLNKGSMELLLLLLQESKKQKEELKSQTWDPESLSVHLQHPCGMPPIWREIDRWPSKIQLNIQNYCKLKRDEESYSRGALHAGRDIKHNLVLKHKHDPNATSDEEFNLRHNVRNATEAKSSPDEYKALTEQGEMRSTGKTPNYHKELQITPLFRR